jgi:hypothetical protein
MEPRAFPVYGLPDIQWVNGYMTAANTTADLTSGTIYEAFIANADNGGRIDKLVFRPTPAGNTTKTVARIWLNNGSATGTAANNVLIGEVALPAVTADADDPTFGPEHVLNMQMKPGHKIYITLGTASANGWACSSHGAKYS